MRTPDPRSHSGRISARISSGRRDRLWTYADFMDLEVPAPTLATILARLARKGLVRRVRPGIYYRPAITTFGETRPDPDSVLAAALRRNGVQGIRTGLDAWRRLGLTTQMAAVPTIATPRRHRMSPVVGHRVRASVRAPTKAGLRDERAVLDALRALKRIPGTTPAEVLDRILWLLRNEMLEASGLAKMALAEPPRVRALTGALIEAARPEGVSAAHLSALRESLNPATHYRIPAAASMLATSINWGIR